MIRHSNAKEFDRNETETFISGYAQNNLKRRKGKTASIVKAKIGTGRFFIVNVAPFSTGLKQ
ncbi:MAG: hypothetical protein Q4C95_12910 [Planctomycetia bacterium]|nr:hypothetical protein [Planctomycetia bacterium]